MTPNARRERSRTLRTAPRTTAPRRGSATEAIEVRQATAGWRRRAAALLLTTEPLSLDAVDGDTKRARHERSERISRHDQWLRSPGGRRAHSVRAVRVRCARQARRSAVSRVAPGDAAPRS